MTEFAMSVTSTARLAMACTRPTALLVPGITIYGHREVIIARKAVRLETIIIRDGVESTLMRQFKIQPQVLVTECVGSAMLTADGAAAPPVTA